MGLFSKKKKLPEFPKLPEKPSFPRYESQVPTPQPFRVDIPEIEPEELNIPMRRPAMPRPQSIPPRELAPAVPMSKGPQPLFVKIDKYKAAINSLNEIKQKLLEAEDTLTKLNAIKIRESDEIARWESEIAAIKERLMSIDKNLFEI